MKKLDREMDASEFLKEIRKKTPGTGTMPELSAPKWGVRKVCQTGKVQGVLAQERRTTESRRY